MWRQVAAWMFGTVVMLAAFVGVLMAAVAVTPYPTYRLIQVPVQTSSGEALCSIELFNRGTPRVLLLGCDGGSPPPGA